MATSTRAKKIDYDDENENEDEHCLSAKRSKITTDDTDNTDEQKNNFNRWQQR